MHRWASEQPDASAGKLRIVGGELKGRQFSYSGDKRTRPMKDNTREALFNLIGGWVPGKAVFDLFSGTGAIGLEAISRGAHHALVVERHFPTAKLIRENATALGVDEKITVESSDAFFWFRQFKKQKESWPTVAWAVFICPPYALFETDTDSLVELIRFAMENAPPESLVVVEFDDRFPIENLPNDSLWKIRQYPPAIIAVYRKDSVAGNDSALD